MIEIRFHGRELLKFWLKQLLKMGITPKHFRSLELNVEEPQLWLLPELMTNQLK